MKNAVSPTKNSVSHINRFSEFFFHKKPNCCLITLSLVFIFCPAIITQAQYNVTGNAYASGGLGCYTLTDTTMQFGAVWNENTINLTQPIDITLTLNFGCNDSDNYPDPNCGADGISFVLQPNGTGSSGSGGGVGFSGILPSFGVIMDTYENGPDDDPTYDNTIDHISININGDVWHGTPNELVSPLIGAANGFPANIEDCNNHTFRFAWLPAAVGGTANIYFDGVLVTSYTGDIVNTIFNGNPVVYWGVSASTGGCWNVQSVCMTVVSCFISTGSYCAGSTINFQDQSISGTTINSWNWNFGDGTSSTLQNPVHTYPIPGNYQVTLTITNIAGFSSTMTQAVTILSPIVTIDSLSPVCEGDLVSLHGQADPSATTIQLPVFSNNTNMAIPDGGVTSGWTGIGGSFATSSITATGILSGWNIESVCLNINHPFDGDLVIYLQDPCGNLLLLSDGQGGGGENFINTCFSPAATNSITTGVSPFSGTWIPQAGTPAWGSLIGCPTPNGTWNLLIGDTYSSDNGNLVNWSITFTIPTSINYVWQPLNITNTLTPTITATNSGWYYLSATDNIGCHASDSVFLTVNPVPLVNVQNDTICSGEQASLQASGADSYVWSNATTNNPLIASPLITTSYIVTGTSLGCSSSSTAEVYVNSSPNISIINDTICEGEQATLDPSGADSYVWNTTATDDPYVITPAITTTYSVTGINNAGCSGTASATVYVNKNPVIQIIAPSVCENAQGTLTASGATTYLWSTSSTANPLLIQPAIAGSYMVTGTTLGCTGTAEATLIVNPKPIPLFNASTTRGCVPLEISFTDQSVGNIMLWNWESSMGTFSTNQNPVYTFNQAGTYPITLTVTSDSGCIASTPPLNIEVLQVIANIITNSKKYDAGDIVNFFDGSLYADTWFWDFGNGMQSHEQNSNSIYNNSGEYLIILTVQNSEGCIDTDSLMIKVNPLFTIYIPNTFSPNNDGVNDTWQPYGESWHVDKYELCIFDRWGKMQFITSDINKPWDGPDMNKLISAQSVYTYKIKIRDINGITHVYEGSITLLQ